MKTFPFAFRICQVDVSMNQVVACTHQNPLSAQPYYMHLINADFVFTIRLTWILSGIYDLVEHKNASPIGTSHISFSLSHAHEQVSICMSRYSGETEKQGKKRPIASCQMMPHIYMWMRDE